MPKLYKHSMTLEVFSTDPSTENMDSRMRHYYDYVVEGIEDEATVTHAFFVVDDVVEASAEEAKEYGPDTEST